MLKLLLLFSLSVSSVLCGGSTLEEMDDKELVKLIGQEQFVIVLFGHKNDALTDDFEGELTLLREDLVDSINAWVVKSIDSELQKEFVESTAKPAIVFFRGQVPVLYTGAANEDDLLEFVAGAKEVCVRELTDVNFEHLTQAATGATTGDWFVMFYKRGEACPECERLRATLETLGCRFKGRMNVAQIDKGEDGAVTGRRFGVQEVPSFIFFRAGKMYRYTIDKLDVESMANFITGFYKNSKAESIPMPKTPFDDLVQFCADYIRENPTYVAVGVAVPVFLLLAFVYLMREEERPKSKKKKSKSKDKSS